MQMSYQIYRHGQTSVTLLPHENSLEQLAKWSDTPPRYTKSFRHVLRELRQSYIYPCTSAITLKDRSYIHRHQTTTKHNAAQTVWTAHVVHFTNMD